MPRAPKDSFFSFLSFFLFFWWCLCNTEVPGPGIEPVPQQQPCWMDPQPAVPPANSWHLHSCGPWTYSSSCNHPPKPVSISWLRLTISNGLWRKRCRSTHTTLWFKSGKASWLFHKFLWGGNLVQQKEQGFWSSHKWVWISTLPYSSSVPLGSYFEHLFLYL